MTWPPSVVFLDRDGVLIENVPTYVREWDEVKVFPKAVEACRILTELGIPLVVVTNQAGVGRKILSLEHVETMNARILSEIEKGGGRFTAAYICPHHPDDGCDCRKPLPGMLLRAAAEHSLDLTNAAMVGDGVTDLLAASAAGVYGVLVRTGRGAEQEMEMRQAGLDRPVFDDLGEAVTRHFKR
jgi:D-glycero-D-manno-heptose 1,7-bisphosphate phosphatase